MTRIDLITGFLGSGKTTFLKMYAKYLVNKGENIGILENDYGAVNVDMMLLSELESDNCELEMVASACHNNCHKRRFKAKLISMGMMGYDRVIVEPSGIFDVDEFFDTLREDPISRMYSIGNVISIVDARLEDDLSDQADFYLASETCCSGIILLSRSQMVTGRQILEVENHLQSAFSKIKVDLNNLPAIETGNWFDFTDKDFEKISSCGYRNCSYEKRITGEDNSYSSVYFLDIPMDTDFVKNKCSILFSSHDFGKVFRIKGFYQEDGKWFEINATGHNTDIKETKTGQQVLIVIGEGLNRNRIESEIKATSYGGGQL